VSPSVRAEESRQVLRRLLEQSGDAQDAGGGLGGLDAGLEQADGDVHAVEHVADVMEDARGDFGLAGDARGIDQLLMHPLQAGFRFLQGGDVARDAKGADDFSGRITPGHFGGHEPGDEVVWMHLLFQLANERLARAEDLLLVGQRHARIFRAEDVEVGPADNLRVREFRAGTEGEAAPDQPRVGILEIDVVRSGIQQGAEQPLFIAEFGVGPGQVGGPVFHPRLQFFIGGLELALGEFQQAVFSQDHDDPGDGKGQNAQEAAADPQQAVPVPPRRGLQQGYVGGSGE